MAADDIRVLLAEDSPTIRRHLANLINESPGMRVVGEARNGEEAIALAAELRPDVISMDIKMPGVDGLEATRRIMEKTPIPVVVVSGLLETELDLSFRALQAGALAVVAKPPDRTNPAFQSKYRQLVTTLAAMARVRVIHRRAYVANGTASGLTTDKLRGMLKMPPEIVAIGASAGGPSALSKLLHDLPADFPTPVVIVQHMAHEFIGGLARWLDKVSALQVQVATDGLVLEAGVVNLSPGDAHLRIVRESGRLVARLQYEQGVYRYQPAVDVLFESVALSCGEAGVGVLLTGMGDDGAHGLLALRRAGGQTFAQDQHSATVFGMPAAAIERGAAEHVISLSHLPLALVKLVRKSDRPI